MSLHTRLFVGNIPKNVSESDIRKAFTSYGEIINLDLKHKSGDENEEKRFAFITLSASNYEVESCIKNIADVNFDGQRLYVTRARESFLDRLQRERKQAGEKDVKKHENASNIFKENPTLNLSIKLNPPNRKIDDTRSNDNKLNKNPNAFNKKNVNTDFQINNRVFNESLKNDNKLSSDHKRLESLKRKRQEFKEKKNIIKTGLVGIDKAPNKKVIFSDNEDEELNLHSSSTCDQENITKKFKNGKNNTLFDDEDSDTEVNFNIKKQFEGKKGQKVLDLQSTYKSDKRFTLDERFIDDDQSDNDKEEDTANGERVDVGQVDEKSKQLSILQDVLGVSIKTHSSEHVQKTKPKLGMLRYDPMHPDHAKFLAPATKLQEVPKKVKKSKKTNETPEEPPPVTITENVEVSKEQFYTVSDTLKEALVQPSTFSLRDLFGKKENEDKEVIEESMDYIPLPKEKEKKSRNPLDTGERNPFVYDSSDSEDEGKEKDKEIQAPEEKQETKAVWRENLFFSKDDSRLKEGLLFFSKFEESEGKKERRGLKTVMKKRIYNKERKNQMFQKKIGGRPKSIKKNIRKRR